MFPWSCASQNETSGEAKSTGQIIRAHRSMKIGMLVLFGMVSTITHKRTTSVPLKVTLTIN